MSTEVPRTGYAKGRATREDILDEAMKLFGEVGYRTASLREVASRVGISHPGLMHHFANKAVLLAAVLERRDEIDGLALQADLDEGLDFFAALAQVAARNASRPGIVELFVNLSAEATAVDHPAHAYFQRRYADLLAKATTAFVALRDAGRLRADVDPRTAARQTIATMDGLQVQWLLEVDGGGERVDMSAALAALHHSFLVG
ncbi:TetR/AcrR family transcriptional regulator [Cellulomonas rhizosphaerae]|uniref:TetR/AcrR family transcriptional regulator n=1 Tax=Cellulomonas rhizosphaerae TaxID=2293719 RepID=A0A413RHN0_9CELL|nr:TetR/AcrR family transcriptional regulator [Cellulomonas rhizosphaerae]RHA37651.1 TetR/AcrR family transcriptional regulator [Cellulomonas rhizosphaerae]